MTRPVFILGGSAWQLDLIRETKRLGHRTLVADISPNAPGRELADEFVEVNTDDRETLLRIAREKNVGLVFSDQADRVVGTLGWLNDRLGLPGISDATAQKFTNKFLMRESLRDADVEMPRYAHVNSIEAALAAAEAFGYPAVLKPKLSWSSLGVHKVDNPEQLRRYYALTLARSQDGGILVEEFIRGMEVTVEGFSFDGAYHLLGVSEKRHYEFNACVANRLAYPPRLPSDALNRIEDRARRIVTHLGLRDGISHAEFRLLDGRPYLMEVAARGGGHRISSVIAPHLSGWPLYDLLYRRLLGQPVQLPPKQRRAAILEFFDFPPGRVRAVQGVEQARAERLAFQIHLDFKAGDTIAQPSDDRTRLGFMIVLGDNRDDVDARANRILELVRVEYDRL
jgi:biotin carboxylase